MVDPATAIDEVPLAFLDVETTGLSPNYGDRVCEVAVLRCQWGDTQAAYQTLVNPQRPMGAGAYAVHGLSDALLAHAPSFGEVADEVLALLEDAVFVGHNAPFDLGFLASELGHVGRPMPRLIALDTLRLARTIYRIPSYALGSLSAHLGVSRPDGAHRAMADVQTTRAVFEHIADDLWRRGVRTVAALVTQQGGNMHYEAPDPLELPEPLRRALSDRTMLWMRYRSQGGQETERLVRPLDVARRGGVLVLVAHCTLRNDQRTFRLDRILQMETVESLD